MDNICLGGEEFGGKRPCHYEWIRQISDECEKYKVNFTVNSIGTVFVKEGKTYYMDRQDLQGKQAYLAGLSHFYQQIPYKLYDSMDGHLLKKEELMETKFNNEKCITCTSMENCIGCVDCGSCKNVQFISYEELIELRKHRNLQR